MHLKDRGRCAPAMASFLPIEAPHGKPPAAAEKCVAEILCGAASKLSDTGPAAMLGEA